MYQVSEAYNSTADFLTVLHTLWVSLGLRSLLYSLGDTAWWSLYLYHLHLQCREQGIENQAELFKVLHIFHWTKWVNWTLTNGTHCAPGWRSGTAGVPAQWPHRRSCLGSSRPLRPWPGLTRTPQGDSQMQMHTFQAIPVKDVKWTAPFPWAASHTACPESL